MSALVRRKEEAGDDAEAVEERERERPLMKKMQNTPN